MTVYPGPASYPGSASPPSGLTIVAADYDDTIVLSRLIAEAFCDLAPSRWLIADPAARESVLPRYFQAYVLEALDEGRVDTNLDRTAAAVWLPRTGPSERDEQHEEELAKITGQYFSRFLSFELELAQRHPASSCYDYLAFLAVRPDCQRRGFGSALLDAHHARLDREDAMAYLEASDEGTRALYLRHGYTDHGTPIQLPDGPVMYPMTRWPARAAGTGRREQAASTGA